MGEEEEQDDAAQRRRQRGDYDERIQPRLEVHYDQQVDEENREGEPAHQTGIGTFHIVDLAAERHEAAARQELGILVDNFVDVAGHAAKIAILYRGVNADDPADIVM